MRRKQSDERRARLKKETIRKLDERTLSGVDLQKVAGGGHKYTGNCPTCP